MNFKVNFGQHILCVLWEVALHHPAIVAGVFSQHFRNRHSFVFAKVEHFHALVIKHESASKVHILVLGRKGRKILNLVLQRWILV